MKCKSFVKEKNNNQRHFTTQKRVESATYLKLLPRV